MIKKALVGIVVAAVGLVVILGANFGPWFRTVQTGLQGQLLQLVDQYELKLNQARARVTEYETVIFEQAKQRSKLGSMIEGLNRDTENSELAMAKSRDEIASLRTRLLEDGFVSTRDGQMSREQVMMAIDRSSRAMKVAQQRLETLEGLRRPCEQQYQVLTRACELAPEKMQELKTLCNDLDSKIRLAREMKDWTNQIDSIAGPNVPSTDDIVRSLRDIESDIDGEIAGLGALLAIQNGPQTNSGSLSIESLINRCELALKD